MMALSAEFCTFCPARGNCVDSATIANFVLQAIGDNDAEIYFFDRNNEISTEIVTDVTGIKARLEALGPNLENYEDDLARYVIDRIDRCATPGSNGTEISCPAINPDVLQFMLDNLETEG